MSYTFKKYGDKLYERYYGKGGKYQEQNNRHSLTVFSKNKIKCGFVKAHEIHAHIHNEF